MQALGKVKSLFANILQENDNQYVLENILSLMPGHIYWMNYQGFYLSSHYNRVELTGVYSENEMPEPGRKAFCDLPLHNKKFNLCEILENIINLYQPLAFEKKLGLMLNIDKAIPQYLIGDSIRIYCIILELLTNALKFTNQGEVNIVATLASKIEQNIVIEILVKDTGFGVLDEKRPEHFVSLKRLTFPYKSAYKITGLSLVKQFIEDLKGEIYLSSAVNKGSSFVCILPLKIPHLAEELFNA